MARKPNGAVNTLAIILDDLHLFRLEKLPVGVALDARRVA
jgi:hypothetical protein